MKTPIHFAALNNHAEIINFLVSKGAKIEGISNKEVQRFAPPNSAIIMDNISPLLIASRKGHTPSFELLLSLGANLHETDVREWNCLHFAAYNGHSNLVKKIIQIDSPENVLLKQKNKQEHLPFDICKLE
jgi:ankyrin repeat protein